MLGTADSQNLARDLALSNLGNMSTKQGINPDEYRAQQLVAIKRTTPHMMIANIVAAGLVSWVAWPTAIAGVVVAWAILLASVSFFVLITGMRKPVRRQGGKKRSSNSAGVLAARKAEIYAALLGGLWGALPAASFSSAPPAVSFIIMGVVMGACGLGAFNLSRMPSAALIYTSIVTSSLAGSAFALGGRGGIAAALLGAMYGIALAAMILQTHYRALQKASDEKSLEDQNEIIKLLLREFESGTKDWLWETDAAGKLRYASERLVQLAGKKHERVLGAKLYQAVSAERSSKGWICIENLMGQRQSIESVEVAIRSKDGTTWWQINAEPIYGEGNAFEGYRGVAVDITEMSRTADELRCAKQAAERASAAKSQFLAVMSHELRTPLNSIVGYAELGVSKRRGASIDPEYVGYAQNILDQARHLSRLINDILDITRIEKGKMELIEQEIDIDELVDIVARMCRVEANLANVTLSERYDVQRLVVYGDLTRLRQIMINIISNAIKFTPSDGHVEIIVGQSQNNEPEIIVRDTGVGIEPSKIEAIFEPFVQAEETKARQFEGAGLGLAISRKLARMHGGDITLTSKPGEGTTAKLSLPCCRVVQSQTPVAAA